MTATRTLPENYTLRWDFDLKREMRAALFLQAVGIVFFMLFGIGLGAYIRYIRPNLDFQQALFGAWDGWALVGMLLFSIMLVISLHEGVHGLFFWVFTRAQPVFGLGWGYAYACAPGWYFTRGQYAIIGLAPFVLLNAVGLTLLAVSPAVWIGALFWLVLLNASGSVGDLWFIARILKEPGDILVEDTGEGFRVYGRG
ncbi:MAG: DUF3267 domain-containing protein [Anaerolineales bacterium]